MRILGIDPSSSCTGVALTEEDRLLGTDAWYRPKTGSATQRLLEFSIWLEAWIYEAEPDMSVVEYLSVVRNAEATRVISHYQAASALASKRIGLVVIEARVTSARKAVLGKGNLSKEEVFARVKKMYPDHDWGRIDKGGGDRADATILALAGPTIAET